MTRLLDILDSMSRERIIVRYDVILAGTILVESIRTLEGDTSELQSEDVQQEGLAFEEPT